MKTLIAILFVAAAVLLPASTQAQTNVTSTDTVTLGWNPNTEPDLGGYRVYFSQSTSVWTHAKNVGKVDTTQVQIPSPGRWFFTLTATNLAGLESLPSNIVEYTMTNGPAKPSTFRLLSASVVRISSITVASNLVYVTQP